MTRRPIVYVVTLTPERGVEGIRALRWILKRLLRGYGLRCLRIEEHIS